jgi:hypothetical protein
VGKLKLLTLSINSTLWNPKFHPHHHKRSLSDPTLIHLILPLHYKPGHYQEAITGKPYRSRNSSVLQCWATGWMMGGSSPGRGWEFFSSPLRSDRRWRPPNLLFNGYQGLFPWGLSCRGVKLTTRLQLVPRSRMRGAIPQLSQYAFMAWCSVMSSDNFYIYHKRILILL